MQKLFKTRLFFQVAIATLAATLATVGIVAATTTIGTSINTGGTLTVTSTTATSTISTGGLTVGTNQFVVQQTSGNVGMGTSSPVQVLDVWGNLQVGTSSTPTLFVNTANGNVGIGTTSPRAKLDVVMGTLEPTNRPSIITNAGMIGEITTVGRGETFGVIGSAQTTGNAFGDHVYGGWFKANADSGEVGLHAEAWDATSEATIAEFSGHNSIKVRINGIGNVGIGTTTPNALLDIASTLPRLYLSDTDFATNGHWFLENNAGVFSLGTTSSALAVSNTRALSITNSGNVGIGTTSPSSLLQAYSTATTTISIDSNSTSKGSCLELKDVDGGGYTYCYALNGALTCSQTSCK